MSEQDKLLGGKLHASVVYSRCRDPVKVFIYLSDLTGRSNPPPYYTAPPAQAGQAPPPPYQQHASTTTVVVGLVLLIVLCFITCKNANYVTNATLIRAYKTSTREGQRLSTSVLCELLQTLAIKCTHTAVHNSQHGDENLFDA